MSQLAQKKCIPCEGGMPALSHKQIQKLMPELAKWKVIDNKLQKSIKFKDFVELMKFTNRLAELAEAEAHHPDFRVHYNILGIEIWTHKVNGLTESDFILAAKTDALQKYFFSIE